MYLQKEIVNIQCFSVQTQKHTRVEAMLSCDSMKIDGSPEARSLPLRQTADQINGGAQGDEK